MRIELDNGKYATGIDERGELFFERYGEHWPAADEWKHCKFIRSLVLEVGRLQPFGGMPDYADLAALVVDWKARALKAESDRDEAQSALGYVLAQLKDVIRYVEEQ